MPATAYSADEVGALEEVLVRAPLGVIEGLAGGLGLGDLNVELGELASGEPLPVVERNGACCLDCLLLGEGEPDVAQQQNHTDEPDCRFGIELDGHDGGVPDPDPDPDPAARPRRRTFTAAYKSEILDRYDEIPKGLPEGAGVVAPGGALRLASRRMAQAARRWRAGGSGSLRYRRGADQDR